MENPRQQTTCQLCGGDHPTELHEQQIKDVKPKRNEQAEPKDVQEEKPGLNKLSEIIPGAPDEIPSIDLKTLPNFLYRPTTKITDLEREFDRNPKLKEELLKYFSNKIIVDIGAGVDDHGFKLATSLGARGYVGVEPDGQNCRQLEKIIVFDKARAKERKQNKYDKCLVHVSQTDMRGFMSVLPDKYPNLTVLISGIDGFILYEDPDGTAKVKDNNEAVELYVQDFIGEMRRVLPVGAVVVIYADERIFDGIKGFRRIFSAKVFEGNVNFLERVE